VTQVGQTITASDDAGSASTETLHEMIQTNADIVAGDSGGPLSSSGGVIGMDTAGNSPSSQQQATGFAIPINTADRRRPGQRHRRHRLPGLHGNLHRLRVGQEPASPGEAATATTAAAARIPWQPVLLDH
jgi:S1-C subfamily serine protease